MGGNGQQDKPSSEQERDFANRLSEARRAHAETKDEPPRSTQGLALRVGSDFFAGIVMGGLLGWGIDRTFGTTPWGLVICLGLGFVTGTRLAIRSANEINRRGQDGS